MNILDKINAQTKVLIIGFGREGQSTYNYLSLKFPTLKFAIADKAQPNITLGKNIEETYFGDTYLDHLNKYQVCIKTPGIPPTTPQIISAQNHSVTITSHMEIFLSVCPSKQTIGVTGTKGKSTTTALIHHVLKENNIKTVLVGNIGIPALDHVHEITPDTWVVMELSSAQLSMIKTSPHIAVMQAIYQDHMDYHKDMAEYVSAKANITKYQTASDMFIYYANNQHVEEISHQTIAQKIPFTETDFPYKAQLKLEGDHNKLNAIPSVIIGKLLGISETAISKSLHSFTPLNTRLEIFNGGKVSFIIDTLATIPEATIAAINTYQSSVKTLIAGGHDRNQNYNHLAQKIIDSNILNVILFPETGIRLEKEINQLNTQNKKINIVHANSMDEAIKATYSLAPENSICLLSPAAPSFTLFKNYEDEAQQLKDSVKKIMATS